MVRRLGAIAAIVGTVVSVAAGMGFASLTNEAGTEEVLRSIAVRPAGYWLTVHVAFMVGALLWTGAFAVIARTLAGGAVRTLGLIGVVSITAGAAVHLVDSSISGSALTVLAGAWADAAPPGRRSVVASADTVLLFVMPAQVVSAWMIAMGVVLWRQEEGRQPGERPVGRGP